MVQLRRNVRFGSKSGRVQCESQCLLWAKSGHKPLRGSDCAHDKHTWQLIETPGHSAYGFSGTSPAAIVSVVPKLICECGLLVSVLEIVTRKFVLAAAAVAILVTLTNVILAGAND